MNVEARPATSADLEELIRMYGLLAEEQRALRYMWPLADGLAFPLEETFARILDDDSAVLVIGSIDGVPFGFGHATVDELLPQAEGLIVGTVRHIFVEEEARGVGIGETMIGHLLEALHDRGVTAFDARVSPGHRNAKNFFEANGFSARLIVMHNPGS